jgi:uncharacterized membrane protein YgaE (UPF0421/DUF939 family)
MQTTELVVSFGYSVLALLGGGGAVLVGVCAFLSKYMADRSIEKHKAELNAGIENQKAALNQQIEGYKAELNTQLERVKSELTRESEVYRLKLRKAEILFDRELQAVSDFGVLYRRIRPEYSRPDMEWEDACDAVAERFSTIEDQLEEYVTTYGAVLTEELREILRRCTTYASHNKFGAYEMPEDQASYQARKAAGQLLDELANVEKALFELVKNEARA